MRPLKLITKWGTSGSRRVLVVEVMDTKWKAIETVMRYGDIG
jgi:hypothetical protein